VLSSKKSSLAREGESQSGAATRQHVFRRTDVCARALVCWSSSWVGLKVSLAPKTSPDVGEGVLLSPPRQRLGFLCSS